ncbi:hypothetical protein [Pyxidicoccus xibeiensis]|uniref:hypothetical protein n=1 Tax=Pyxidicoccus xibeiensis TaxID=2906759 RepID=UPI0020A6EAC7|nr:hypothetical protein [Pyxidicoccus xibeiensis]MCP3143497.1 hypothetical protein [Pyxidicoccus xibeiensis]
MSVHTIGQALAWARGSVQKHGITQVDRLLPNEAVDVWKLAAAWCRTSWLSVPKRW